jgi:hypothetical protein
MWTLPRGSEDLKRDSEEGRLSFVIVGAKGIPQKLPQRRIGRSVGPAVLSGLRYLLICVLLFGLGLVCWLLGGRRIVTVLDRISLALIDFPALEHLVYDTGTLELGGKRLDLMSPAATWAGEMSLSSSGHAVLESGGRRFSFGPGHTVPSIGGLPKFEFAKDPGDETSFTVEQSRLAWPTPFETNFMTGYVPSRKRNVYFRLRWTKLSGAKLNMLWKTEQGYYRRDGWMPPRIEGVAMGLTRVDIDEATDLENAADEYLKRVKGWSPEQYRLEDRGPSPDLSEEVFFALHSDDESNSLPGAGRSVELRVSYKDRKVMREIGGQ